MWAGKYGGNMIWAIRNPAETKQLHRCFKGVKGTLNYRTCITHKKVKLAPSMKMRIVECLWELWKSSLWRSISQASGKCLKWEFKINPSPRVHESFRKNENKRFCQLLIPVVRWFCLGQALNSLTISTNNLDSDQSLFFSLRKIGILESKAKEERLPLISFSLPFLICINLELFRCMQDVRNKNRLLVV